MIRVTRAPKPADGKPVTIPNAEGDLTTPSIVYFESETEIVVGREAKRVILAEPEKVAVDVKRFMGDDVYPKTLVGTQFTPVILSGMILMKLVRDTVRQIGPAPALTKWASASRPTDQRGAPAAESWA